MSRKIEYRITNNNFQKKVLPIISKSELAVKETIATALLFSLSLTVLRKKLEKIIKTFSKSLPKDLIDRDSYIQGFSNSTEKMLEQFYFPAMRLFLTISLILKANNINNIYKYNSNIKIYREYIKQGSEVRKAVDSWSHAKAIPSFNVGFDYAKKIKKLIGGLDRQSLVSSEDGKKPISLWQKVELDLRHDAQIEKLEELKKNESFIDVGQGRKIQLAWTSSHPDCSKRCEPFQGKLMDLTSLVADNYDFTMNYKVDGHKVYCFNAIESQVDKYGYHNNIINGFNCRHHLIPYSKGVVPVNDYTAKEIKVERAINEKLRMLERTIRHLKIEARNNKLIDLNYSKQCTLKAKQLTLEYERLCEKYGFAVQFYRLEV